MKNLSHKLKADDGFTLIELVVSMAIFVVVIGVVATTYALVQRAQQRSVIEQINVSDAQFLTERIGDLARSALPDYQYYLDQGIDLTSSPAGIEELALVLNDGTTRRVEFDAVGKKLWLHIDDLVAPELLNDPAINVLAAWFWVEPALDPFQKDADNNFAYLADTQPRVTFRLVLENEDQRVGYTSAPFEVQTTVNAGIYKR